MIEENVKVAKKKSLGPHGVGDPDDLFLRKVELEILIPQIMKDKAKSEKCNLEVADFHKCALENGISLIINCRKENQKMKECLTKWYSDSGFKQACTQEYLNERSEYRRTGIKRKDKLAAAVQ